MRDNKEVDESKLLEIKADELISLLQKGNIDARRIRAVQRKINDAVDTSSLPTSIGAFKELDIDRDRVEMLNDFEMLLSHHQLDSDVSKKYIGRERLRKMVVVIIGIIMITLGMAMIIMPAPPYFEMFTIFYFNPNDGVTIMDLISLLIVFTGVYLLLSAVLKKQSS